MVVVLLWLSALLVLVGVDVVVVVAAVVVVVVVGVVVAVRPPLLPSDADRVITDRWVSS